MFGWRSARVTSISRRKISWAASSTWVVGQHELEGDLAAVGAGVAEVDGAHAAPPEEPLDLVVADQGARREVVLGQAGRGREVVGPGRPVGAGPRVTVPRRQASQSQVPPTHSQRSRSSSAMGRPHSEQVAGPSIVTLRCVAPTRISSPSLRSTSAPLRPARLLRASRRAGDRRGERR